MKIKTFLQYMMIMMACFQANASIQKVFIQALFLDKAMVSINGQSQLLVVGQPSPEGIILVSATSDGAVLRINGKQGNYPLGNEVDTSFSSDIEVVVQLVSNAMGMYSTAGSINEQPVDFVIDTGASVIAMNGQQAKDLGIDFRLTGKPGRVITASNIENVYQVKLKTVKIGDIELRNIDAVVMDGPQPSSILLGMSFLRNVKMESDGKVMELRKIP